MNSRERRTHRWQQIPFRTRRLSRRIPAPIREIKSTTHRRLPLHAGEIQKIEWHM